MAKKLIEVKRIVSRNLDGTPNRKSFYGHTRREANEKADAYIESLRTAIVVSDDINFEQWAKKWLEVYKKDKVKEYTYKFTYEKNVDKYINPYFGKARLCDIKQIDVQNFFNKHNYLSVAMQKKFHIILHDIFDKAIDNELCYKNPVKGINITSKAAKVVKSTYNLKEVETAVKWAVEYKNTAMLILLKTGVRRSELLGLKWSAVDLESKLIHINQAITPKATSDSDQTYDVKSASSNRTIPIDDELVAYLKDCERDSGYVVPMTPGGYAKKFKKDMEKLSVDCNLMQLTPHELRHTFGTILREKGVDIYTIQKVMGHSDIKMAADIYVHNDIEVLRKSLKL